MKTNTFPPKHRDGSPVSFDELVSGILAVPKSVVDQKLAAEKAAKKRKAKRKH
jgi:hypothetical protein